MPTTNDYDPCNTAGVGSRMAGGAGSPATFGVIATGAGGTGNPGTFGATGTTIIGSNGTTGRNPSIFWQQEPIQPYEHVIQGQMFMVDAKVSEVAVATMSDAAVKDRIKEDIAFSLAMKMIEEGVISFTQIPDVNTGKTTIKARCFLVPDNQVRILRTLYKDK
jgi:hypothetical protein